MEEINLGKSTVSNVVHCPFNHAHAMPQKSLILHLTKCKDRKPNHRICPFNNLHIMDVTLLEEHQAQCPNRLAYDQILYEIKADKPVVELVRSAPNQADESWGDDMPVGNTSKNNVLKVINQRPSFMKPKLGLTKSEQKNHLKDMKKKYFGVDISYNPNMSISERLDSTNCGTKETNQQPLFIGKRSSIEKNIGRQSFH